MPDFKKFIDTINRYKTYPTPVYKTKDNFSVEVAYDTAIKDASSRFINNAIKKIDFTDKLIMYRDALGNNFGFNNIDKFFSKFSNALKASNELDLDNELVNSYYGKDKIEFPDDRLKRLINFIDGHKDNEVIKSTLKNLDKDLTSDINQSMKGWDYKQYYDLFDVTVPRIIDKYDLDEFTPDEKDYLCYLDNPKNDTPKYEEKINKIIGSLDPVKDKEYIKTLKAANEIAFKITSSNQVQSKVAEYAGHKADLIKQERVYNDLEDNNRDIIKYFDKTTRLIQVVDETNVPKVLKDVINNGGMAKVSDSNQEKINAIFEKMDRYGISPEGLVGAEQGSKSYSLTKLVKIHNEIDKELAKDNIDKEKLTKLTNDYLDLEKKYDELLEDVSKLGEEDIFPSNMSSTRVDAVSEKYRLNISNVSKLNALWISRGHFKGINTSINEFMDNPIKTEKEAVKFYLSNETEIGKYFKNHQNNRIELLDKFVNIEMNPELYEVFNRTSVLPSGTDRSISAITSLIDDRETRLQIEKEMMIYNANVTSKVAGCITGFVKDGIGYDNDKIINTVNLLVAPPKDFNPLTFTVQKEKMIDPDTLDYMEPYNTALAIEETGAKESISRIMDLNRTDIFRDNELKNINNYFNEKIIEADVTLTKTDNKIIKLLTQGKEISETLRTTFNCEKTIEEINKDGLNKDNIEKTLQDYADIKKSYKSRNIFAQIFFSGVRKQNALIQSMKEKFKENGISVDKADEYAENYNFNRDTKNTLDSVKKDLEPIKITNQSIQISIDEKEFEEKIENQKDLDKTFELSKDEIELGK